MFKGSLEAFSEKWEKQKQLKEKKEEAFFHIFFFFTRFMQQFDLLGNTLLCLWVSSIRRWIPL